LLNFQQFCTKLKSIALGLNLCTYLSWLGDGGNLLAGQCRRPILSFMSIATQVTPILALPLANPFSDNCNSVQFLQAATSQQ